MVEYDVIIVGGGPAGCSAAVFSARMGQKVLLVDKEIFPRDKICGDGISANAIASMERMGVMDAIDNDSPWQVDSLVITSPKGVVMNGRIVRADGFRDYGYAMPRKRLDNFLFSHAKEQRGVTALEGFRVTDLLYERNRIAGIRGKANGESREFTGRYIVAADGAHSIIARRLGLINNIQKHRAFAARAYFENVEEIGSAIELHYEETILPGYGWIFPTGEGKANVGIGLFNRFIEIKGVNQMFERFIKNNDFAKRKLKNAKMVEGSFKGWPIPFGSFPGPRTHKNVLLTGDAASFVDNMTGEGIYYALRSGEYAAQAIGEGALRNSTDKEVGNHYRKLWQREFKWKEFLPGYIAQPLLNNMRFMEFTVNRAAKNKKKAEVLTGVISHRLPKTRLLFNL